MKSILFKRARRIASAIRRAGRCSRLVAHTRMLREHFNVAFRIGRFGMLSDDVIDHSDTLYRLRRAGMHARENALTERALQKIKIFLLSSRVSDFGLFFLLTGILFFILTLLIPPFSTFLQRTAALTLALLSLPLLPSGRSLSYVLQNSRIFKKILFEVCEIPSDLFNARANGEEHSLGILIAIALSVATAALISPLYWCFGAFFAAALMLLFFIPELTLYLFALGFPLFPLLPIPTVTVCILAMIVWLSYLGKALCGRRQLTPMASDLFAALFLFSMLLGAWISFGAINDGLVHALLISLGFPARNLLSDRQPCQRFGTALTLGAFLCATIGIFQYFFAREAPLWLDVDRFSDISMRVTSTFSNPNVLSVYLLLCFPFALNGAFDATFPRLRRFFFALTAFAVAFCTILTWTRGAWLGILLQLLLFILLHSKETLAAGLLLSPALICAIPYLPQNILHRFSSIGTLSESSIRYRIYTWEGVKKLIAAHPWGIGVGEAAFCTVYPRYALPGIESVMHAHNVYLQIALETGIAGLISFLLFLFAVFLQGTAHPIRSNPAILSLCGILIMGLFDHLWYFRPLAALCFVIIGIAGR